jgi:hypothetical protein
VARKGKERGAYSDLMGKSGGKRHVEDLGINGRIILKLLFQEQEWGSWAGLI